MIGKVSTILLYSFLALAAGCGSKSEVTRRPTATPPSPPPQQPAPASSVSSDAPSEQQPQEEENAGANAGSTASKLDACTLLTSSEIQEVQGEPVKDAKSSDRSSGSFAISQCFYTLPTFVKSISLEVTRPNPANKTQNGPKEFWTERFHQSAEKKKKEDRDSEEEGGKGREEEEEKEARPPQPVSGVGDEAFWLGNRITGALYVLKSNSILRISIGGPGEVSSKLDKSKALAQKAIKRL